MTYIPITDPEVAPEAPITTSLMTRLRDNTLSYWGAATGVIALALQTAAPLGWTKLTDMNDVALRVVSGTVGSGGVLPFTTVFGKQATDDLTLAQTHLPNSTLTINGDSHLHAVPYAVTNVQAGATASVVNAIGSGGLTGNSQSADPAATAQLGGSGAPHAHGMDIRVQYTDAIRIQKA